ncbi:MAG: hypothetical protein GY884_33885, partial [Proteobacteria bacterium]|nr:hypothetical protein [Pseudomonadota bacterium]
DLKNGVDEQSIRDEWQEALDDLASAMHWLVDDPETFPGGVSVVLANIFDVTDETGAADIADCEGAELIGLSDTLLDPLTAELALHWQQSVLELSVETGIDVVFLGEAFCGRGYNYDDATGRCYRGGEVDNYLDASCEHPSKYGHAAIAELVLGVLDE